MRVLASSLLVAAALGLSGCGFTPLYAQPGVTPALASVQVTAPEGRTGYLLREQLDDALGHKPGAPGAYKLYFSVKELRFARGVRLDNVANRYELRMTVDWRLLDAKSGAEAVLRSTPTWLTASSTTPSRASASAFGSRSCW